MRMVHPKFHLHNDLQARYGVHHSTWPTSSHAAVNSGDQLENGTNLIRNRKQEASKQSPECCGRSFQEGESNNFEYRQCSASSYVDQYLLSH